jgi:DNA-binding Xre family transcriptional regulator
MENVEMTSGNGASQAQIEATPMLSLEEIKNKLQDRKLYAVSEATGLSYPTLKKLHDGETSNFTLDTIQKVSDYFNANK